MKHTTTDAEIQAVKDAVHGHVCPHPRIVQIVMAPSGDLYALNDHGELWMREWDRKNFNQGPNTQTLYVWKRVEGPEEPYRDFGGPVDANG